MFSPSPRVLHQPLPAQTENGWSHQPVISTTWHTHTHCLILCMHIYPHACQKACPHDSPCRHLHEECCKCIVNIIWSKHWVSTWVSPWGSCSVISDTIHSYYNGARPILCLISKVQTDWRICSGSPPGAMLRRPFHYHCSLMYAAVYDINYAADSVVPDICNNNTFVRKPAHINLQAYLWWGIWVDTQLFQDSVIRQAFSKYSGHINRGQGTTFKSHFLQSAVFQIHSKVLQKWTGAS